MARIGWKCAYKCVKDKFPLISFNTWGDGKEEGGGFQWRISEDIRVRERLHFLVWRIFTRDINHDLYCYVCVGGERKTNLAGGGRVGIYIRGVGWGKGGVSVTKTHVKSDKRKNENEKKKN
jgi:hypothetical protein